MVPSHIGCDICLRKKRKKHHKIVQDCPDYISSVVKVSTVQLFLPRDCFFPSFFSSSSTIEFKVLLIFFVLSLFEFWHHSSFYLAWSQLRFLSFILNGVFEFCHNFRIEFCHIINFWVFSQDFQVLWQIEHLNFVIFFSLSLVKKNFLIFF